MKKKLLMFYPSKIGTREWVDSGVLSSLKAEFDLSFILGGDGDCKYLEQFGDIQSQIKVGSRLAWVLWQLNFGLKGIVPRIKIVEGSTHDLSDVVDSVCFGFSRRVTKFVKILTILRLNAFVSRLIDFSQGALIKDGLKEHFDCALLISGIKDPYWDRVMLMVEGKKIPSLTVTTNWDNISSKYFVVKPDYLGVWGEQGAVHARLWQGMCSDKIRKLGTPRLEPHLKCMRGNEFTREYARSKLTLCADKSLILFAGSGVSFDEVSLLISLEREIESGRLPGVHILYKPHPTRHKRTKEPAFEDQTFKHVSLYGMLGGGATNLEEYPLLFKAVDAMISPFSTMLVEACIFETPCLALGYNSDSHMDYDWSIISYSLHLTPVMSGELVLKCLEESDFMPKVKALVDRIGIEPVVPYSSISNYVVHQDENSYPERLVNVLNEISG